MSSQKDNHIPGEKPENGRRKTAAGSTGTYSAALVALERLCSLREYCESDIRKKLKRFELTEEEKEKIVDELVNNSFLSNIRYARAFVRDKVRLSGWGRNKIIYMLRSKKLEDKIISEAMEEYPQQMNKERLKELLIKKSREIKVGESYEKMMGKLVRFALLRGFDYDETIREVKLIIDQKVRKTDNND